MNVRTTLAILLALLTVLMGIPATPAAAETETRVWALDAQGGITELLAHSMRGQEECGGTAPSETHCTTALHAASEVWSIALGASFTYTGTLEIRLFHATNVLVMQVHIIEGEFAGGNIYGTFPLSPAVFWHECFSYELGTAGNAAAPLPFEENGTPGGSGVWSCFVLYP